MTLPTDINPRDPIDASWLNDVKNAIFESITGDGVINAHASGDQLVLRFAGRIPGPYVTSLARVTEVRFNTLMVTTGAGAQVSDPFPVAKAWSVMPALNQSPRGASGGTYDLDRLEVKYAYDYTPDETLGMSRLVTTVPDPPEVPVTESQIVIPTYFVGGLVLIGPVPMNYEDEIAEYVGPQPPPEGTPPVNDNPSGLTFMDIGTRMWAESWLPVEPAAP